MTAAPLCSICQAPHWGYEAHRLPEPKKRRVGRPTVSKPSAATLRKRRQREREAQE